MALPKQAQDFPSWYQEVTKGAELAENSMVRGTMVIRPYGFAIWEAIQSAVDRRIKATGHQNLYFPLFIPYRLLEKEVEHVEGFAPEVAMVTHAGGKKLDEPVVVRPTSETLIWATYATWIQSYRDLPLLYNQWCNVVRWEMRTRLFLRTTEFLWQEGHTAHETADEAQAEQRKILLDVYRETVEEDLAVPVLLGRKSEAQRFPGAVESFTMEALMRDGKALQAGTSHYFGQNLGRVYDVKFLGRDGKEDFAYATSWGVSTRLIGGLVMAHGDDKGLRLPPRLAPTQVVIIPIYRSPEERSATLDAADRVEASLEGIRTKIDDREEHRPGFKFNEWELKGVPLRLEIGPRELQQGEAGLYRRDTEEKRTISLDSLGGEIPGLLDEIQKTLFDQAAAFRESRTLHTESYDEMREFLNDPGGFVVTAWCGSGECEETVKVDTKADIRTLPLDPEESVGACIVCGQPAAERATWAQAY
jgi:prolyl-tRNA synthetase